MYEKTHKIIQEHLKKGHMACEMDKVLFTKYSRGEINLNTCMEMFKENNKIPDKFYIQIKPEDFVQWLKEIGYVRY